MPDESINGSRENNLLCFEICCPDWMPLISEIEYFNCDNHMRILRVLFNSLVDNQSMILSE